MKVLFIHAAGEHLGIEYLSAYLKSAGHETALLFDPAQFSGQENARIPFIHRLTDITRDIVAAAAESGADVIAFSAYTVNLRWALDMAARVRKRTDTPIIFGGPHATAVPAKLLENPHVDAVIVGEAEEALLELVEEMRGGALPEKPVRNVWRRRNDAIEPQPPRPYIRDLDALPYPDKDLFYSKIPAFADNYMVMASRGCPYKCAFCSNSMYHHLYAEEKNHVRRRSPGGVVDEIKWAAGRYGIGTVSFWDDVFTMDLSWLERFAELYLGLRIPYDCYTHPNMVDERRAELLARTGCFRVKIGMQTASDETRKKYLDRVGSVASVKRAVEILHDHGISVGVDHMLGLPGEGSAEQEMAAQFYSEARPDRINSYWMLYFPGAKITSTHADGGELSEAQLAEIEAGRGHTSYIYADKSSGDDRWRLRAYQTFFDLEPMLPRWLARWISSRGLAGRMPYHPMLRQIIAASAALFQNDRRYRQHLKLMISRKNAP